MHVVCHYSNVNEEHDATVLSTDFSINTIAVGNGALEDLDSAWQTSYGDGVEFIEPTNYAEISSSLGWINKHQQSPAVAIVAAKLKYIHEQTQAGWSTIRNACRATATQSAANIAAGIVWDKYRGFGVINVTAAITYIENLKLSFKNVLRDNYKQANSMFKDLELSDFDENTPLPKKLVVHAPKGEYADNTAALTAGLSVGDYYHTAGVIKVVIPAT